MTVSKLLWGTNFENEIRLGYPLFDVLTDREEREGSQHLQGASGTEDAWMTGRDYVMETEIRWIPDAPGTNPLQTQLSGAVSWQEFLDWARDANPFRFVPDETVPDFYLDNTYLVEPGKGFGSLTADIKRKVQLKLRNATKDFHEALRGIMFEYAPGTDITQPIGYTFTRGSAGSRLAKGLTNATDAANVLRDRYYDGALRTTRLESSRTNKQPASEDLNNATYWTKVNTLTVTAAAFTSGDLVMDLLNDDSGSNEYLQSVTTHTFTRTTACFSVHVKKGTSTRSQAEIFNTVALTRSMLDVTWNADGTVSSTSVNNGSLLATIPMADGVYRFLVRATNVNTADTYVSRLFPVAEALGAGATGTCYFGGVQVEDSTYPSSYFKTTTAAAPRSFDKLLYPFTHAPQGLAIYLKLVERGFRFGVGDDLSATVALQVGDSPNRLTIEAGNVGTGPYTFSRFFAAGSASSTSTVGSEGQVVELLGILRPTGTVQIKKVLDGGAEAAGSESAGVALPPSFGSLFIHLGSINGVSNGGVVPLIRAKVMPLSFGGAARDTIAKAAAA